jgi:hypothetical protein
VDVLAHVNNVERQSVGSGLNRKAVKCAERKIRIEMGGISPSGGGIQC